jgi:cytosine/adenosine deaminase-related metal-dependent hydrolase
MVPGNSSNRFRLICLPAVSLACLCVAVSGCSESNHPVPIQFSSRSDTGRAGICTFRRGTGPEMLVIGSVVLNTGQLQDNGLLIAERKIAAIDKPQALLAAHGDASVIQCEHAFISPGFIDAHEHPAFSFLYPAPRMPPVYLHRDEWRFGLNGKPQIPAQPTKDPAVLAWVEIRHLLHGVTTLAGPGGISGIVKNAGGPSSLIYAYEVDMQPFPFGQNVERSLGTACHSDASKLGDPMKTAGISDTAPYVPHVGEGRDCAAELELDDYLAYVVSHPGRKYSLIHGVMLNRQHIKDLLAGDVSVIWSPRSNLALYGTTLDPTWLLDSGVSVALGTDWSLSGSFNMLDEISCAARVNSVRGTRTLTGKELWQMSTISAARAIGIDRVTGSIEPGKAADLVIINDPRGKGVEEIGSIGPSDVIAVFVDGQLMAADAQKFPGTGDICANQIDGKLLCIDFKKYDFSFTEMRAVNVQNVGLIDVSRQAACSP